jgi:NAD-dependent oxidoreductase involved in siderophore biosynthesis
VIGLLISPLPEIDAAAKALCAMSSEGEEPSRSRDEAAITWREQAANVEREERSWIPHALNFAVAGGSSLVLWKGFDRGTAERGELCDEHSRR